MKTSETGFKNIFDGLVGQIWPACLSGPGAPVAGVRVVFRAGGREMTKEEQVVGLIFEVTMWAYIAAAAYVVIG
jgi:hypothetical protein